MILKVKNVINKLRPNKLPNQIYHANTSPIFFMTELAVLPVNATGIHTAQYIFVALREVRWTQHNGSCYTFKPNKHILLFLQICTRIGTSYKKLRQFHPKSDSPILSQVLCLQSRFDRVYVICYLFMEIIK